MRKFDHENSSFARFARAFFIFVHFAVVLVILMPWNDLFCSCVDDVSTWRQTFNVTSKSFILISFQNSENILDVLETALETALLIPKGDFLSY